MHRTMSGDNKDLISILAQLTQIQQSQAKAIEDNHVQLQSILDRVADGQLHAGKFPPFDSSSELWSDYKSRYTTYCLSNGVTKQKATYFLSCQTPSVYKQVEVWAIQTIDKLKSVNSLDWDTIDKYMTSQYGRNDFIVKERYRFFKEMGMKENETISQLAARTLQLASTCAFEKVTNPLDEYMRMFFIGSIKNSAILKALFAVPDDELTFEKAVKTVQIAWDASELWHSRSLSALTKSFLLSTKWIHRKIP